MKRFFNSFDGLTGFAWVLILGLILSLIFATKIAFSLWDSGGVSIVFCILVWITIGVTGFVVSLGLAYLYHQLFK